MSRKRILVVDDEPQMCELLQAILEHFGHTVAGVLAPVADPDATALPFAAFGLAFMRPLQRHTSNAAAINTTSPTMTLFIAP